jgi:predicted ATPase
LALLDDTHVVVARTGERWFTAELNRLKGQSSLRHGRYETAEEQYRMALGIAQEQKARFWELRAP